MINMNICLYGSASTRITDEIYSNEVYELGCRLAQEGHKLIFGGGDTGMMGACAKGFHDNDGITIGIAPHWIDKYEPLCETCLQFIYVDSIEERKEKFREYSDAFIITPGGSGTLDEFFEILTLKKLGQHDKPIIIFNINNYFNKMLEMLDEMNKKGFLYLQKDITKIADNVDEIIEYLG